MDSSLFCANIESLSSVGCLLFTLGEKAPAIPRSIGLPTSYLMLNELESASYYGTPFKSTNLPRRHDSVSAV